MSVMMIKKNLPRNFALFGQRSRGMNRVQLVNGWKVFLIGCKIIYDVV